MKKIIRHFKRWNIWRKHNCNSKLHQFLVLIGLSNSPTLGSVLLPEECKAISDAFDAGLLNISICSIGMEMHNLMVENDYDLNKVSEAYVKTVKEEDIKVCSEYQKNLQNNA